MSVGPGGQPNHGRHERHGGCGRPCLFCGPSWGWTRRRLSRSPGRSAPLRPPSCPTRTAAPFLLPGTPGSAPFSRGGGGGGRAGRRAPWSRRRWRASCNASQSDGRRSQEKHTTGPAWDVVALLGHHFASVCPPPHLWHVKSGRSPGAFPTLKPNSLSGAGGPGQAVGLHPMPIQSVSGRPIQWNAELSIYLAPCRCWKGLWQTD